MHCPTIKIASKFLTRRGLLLRAGRGFRPESGWPKRPSGLLTQHLAGDRSRARPVSSGREPLRSSAEVRHATVDYFGVHPVQAVATVLAAAIVLLGAVLLVLDRITRLGLVPLAVTPAARAATTV